MKNIQIFSSVVVLIISILLIQPAMILSRGFVFQQYQSYIEVNADNPLILANLLNYNPFFWLSVIEVTLYLFAAGLAFVIANRSNNALNRETASLKEFAESFKKGIEVSYESEFIQTDAVKNEIIYLEKTYRETVQVLYSNLKELENLGKATPRDFVSSRLISSGEYRRVIDSINRRFEQIIRDLNTDNGKRGNNVWVDLESGIIGLKQKFNNEKKFIQELSGVLQKLKSGNFRTGMLVGRNDNNSEIKSQINFVLENLNKFLSELHRISGENFNAQLTGTYPGDMENLKNDINRALENNNRKFKKLEENLSLLEKKEKFNQRSIQQEKKGMPLKSIQKLTFEDIDFTNKSFGKY